MDRLLFPEHQAARQLRRLFQAFPNASFSLARGVPGGWSTLCDIIRGEQTYVGLKRSMGPLGLGIDLAAAALLVAGVGEEQTYQRD